MWDKCPGDKDVFVAYDGEMMHTFILDMDNVSGPSVHGLGNIKRSILDVLCSITFADTLITNIC